MQTKPLFMKKQTFLFSFFLVLVTVLAASAQEVTHILYFTESDVNGDGVAERLFQVNIFAGLAGSHQGLDVAIDNENPVVAQTLGSAETLDGVPYNNSYCWIIRIGGGQFAEVTEFLDTELVTSVFG